MVRCPPKLSQVTTDTAKLPVLVPVEQVIQILNEYQAAHLADTDVYFACSAKQAGEATWIETELPPWGGSFP